MARNGLTFEVATPFFHTSSPYGLNVLLRQFAKERYGVPTAREAKSIFKSKSFLEQKALLKEFYEVLGYKMPDFSAPGTP